MTGSENRAKKRRAMSESKRIPATAQRPELGNPVRAHLGDQLRKFYSSIVAEPVPDRLAELLDELEKKERAGAGGDEDHR
jgi:hypothetical protein